MDFTLAPGQSVLTVSDGEHRAEVSGALPEAARTRALDGESAEKNLAKTGGTQYYVNHFHAEIAPGLMLPASALNAMRREAVAKLDEMRGAVPVREPGAWSPVPAAPHERICGGAPSPLWARFYTAEQMGDGAGFERILLPVSEITPEVIRRAGAERLTAELPAVCFPDSEDRLGRRLAALKESGLREIWTDNIYGVSLGRRLGLGVRGGFGLNIANSEAVDFYEAQGLLSLTVSFEISMRAVRALGGRVPRGIAAYGRLPLMRFRNCPVRAHGGCGACGGRGALTDRKGIEFPVECAEKRYSTLLNSVPLDISGQDDPADFRLLWFTREEPDRCRRVADAFREGRKPDEPHTGGLYYRKLL